jgi:hypothetical protein
MLNILETASPKHFKSRVFGPGTGGAGVPILKMTVASGGDGAGLFTIGTGAGLSRAGPGDDISEFFLCTLFHGDESDPTVLRFRRA